MSCAPVCCADGCNKEEVIKTQHNSRDYNQEHDPQLLPQGATYVQAHAKQATIAEEEPLAVPTLPPPEEKKAPPPQLEEKREVQPAPAPEPAPPPAQALQVAKPPDQDNYLFDAKIVKGGKGLGVDLSPHDGKTLLVGKVKDGAIADWNASQPADGCNVVARGDRVVAVNGKEGSAEDILAQMRADDVLNMRVRRRLLINVRVRRTPGDELGVNLVEMEGGCIIESITSDSAAGKANRKHGSELELRPGDYVIQANGCTESAKIKEQMQSGKDVEFKLRRANEKPCLN